MKTITTAIALAACFAALLPAAALAAPKHVQKATAPTIYECVKCHMKVSAAIAKKDHYKDPMDGGKLVPVKATAKTNANKAKSSSMSPMGM